MELTGAAVELPRCWPPAIGRVIEEWVEMKSRTSEHCRVWRGEPLTPLVAAAVNLPLRRHRMIKNDCKRTRMVVALAARARYTSRNMRWRIPVAEVARVA